MTGHETAQNISVVLVETFQPGNLGSAARAMKNMRLKRLKLVNPCRLSDPECQRLAVGAFDLIENALVYDSLDEALAEESLVIGTTSTRGRSQKVRLYTPREIAPIIRDHAPSQKVSIVFGPERRGLTDRELALCQYLVSIPASPNFATLNLAHSVLILAYEIFLSQPTNLHPKLPLANESARKRMFEHMEEVLIHIGFLSRSNPGHIMRSIRRFLSKAEMTDRDVQIVRGIMSQMEWYATAGKELPPGEVEKP